MGDRDAAFSALPELLSTQLSLGFTAGRDTEAEISALKKEQLLRDKETENMALKEQLERAEKENAQVRKERDEVREAQWLHYQGSI